MVAKQGLTTDEATLAKLGDLGELQCTPAEVAATLGTSEERLGRFFERYGAARAAFAAGKARGAADLRRAQLKLAQTNASMAIILGKAYLGQAERREAAESDAFDVEAAGQRVRNKVAAVADSAETPGDREGD